MTYTSRRKEEGSWSMKTVLTSWSRENLYPISSTHSKTTKFTASHLQIVFIGDYFVFQQIQSEDCWLAVKGDKGLLGQEIILYGEKVSCKRENGAESNPASLQPAEPHQVTSSKGKWSFTCQILTPSMWTLQRLMIFLEDIYRYVCSFQIGHQQTKEATSYEPSPAGKPASYWGSL